MSNPLAALRAELQALNDSDMSLTRLDDSAAGWTSATPFHIIQRQHMLRVQINKLTRHAGIRHGTTLRSHRP